MKTESCEHQVLLTLRYEEFNAYRNVAIGEMNEPYGIIPQEMYDDMYIAKFVACAYYDEHFGTEDYEPVWKLIHKTRKHYYDSYGMEYACGSEIEEINKKTDWHMIDDFQTNLDYCIAIDDPNGIKLYSKALELMTY